MKMAPPPKNLPWQASAQCASSFLPLALWDVESERPAAQLSLGLTLCSGCPVAAECAQAALASQATGQIRAGIPLSPDRLTPTQVEALELIAAGGSMVQAAMLIAQAERYHAAVHTLWAFAMAEASRALTRARSAARGEA